jgi:hypothetical protein
MNLRTFAQGFSALLLFALLLSGLEAIHLHPVHVHAQAAIPEATPNDPGYQDGVARQMNLPAAWAKALSMEASLPPLTEGRPAILVLDSALDCTNRDIKDVCVPELNRDFTTDNNYNDDAPDHGTGVASKIVGGWNNAFQATPILPRNRLLLIGGKVFSAAGIGRGDWLRAGLDYAVELKTKLGINVIGVNFSGGSRENGPDEAPAETQKRFEALARNHIVLGLAVAGSSSPGSLDGGNAAFLSLIPRYPNTFAVDPILSDGQTLAPTFPWGLKTVGFAAPGQNINQAAAGIDRADVCLSGSGSSVSTPETLGIVAFTAIYRQMDPVLALYVVKATAKQIPSTTGKIGWGVPDAYAALTVDFTAPSTGLSLMTESNSPVAAVVDSVTRQPIPVPINNPHNFSADGRGRAMFFSPNTEVIGTSAVLELKDVAGTVTAAPIEHMSPVPSHPQFSQITVRIPDGLVSGDYWATLVNGAQRSNSVIVSFQ